MAKTRDQRRETESEPDEEEVYEVYANAFSYTAGAFDFSIELGLRHGNETPVPKARVHMSLEHTWVMVKLIDRFFQQFRQQGGKFTIPTEVLSQLGLMDEFREDFGDQNESANDSRYSDN